MALAKPIKGIIGACLTPFGEDDRVNYDALKREIDFILADCDAISIAAVEAAEYTVLSREERKELLRIGTEMVDNRLPVLVGCSSPSPREVIELAEYGAGLDETVFKFASDVNTDQSTEIERMQLMLADMMFGDPTP